MIVKQLLGLLTITIKWSKNQCIEAIYMIIDGIVFVLQLALNVLIRVVQNRSILYFWVTIYSKNRRVTIGTYEYLQNKTIQKGKYLPVLLQKSPFESNGG